MGKGGLLLRTSRR
uniref:Uncharacterized protein n=1 Tax=Arundo donax TaxID=35708 RepID=A0A0A9H8Q6_ARUDO